MELGGRPATQHADSTEDCDVVHDDGGAGLGLGAGQQGQQRHPARVVDGHHASAAPAAAAGDAATPDEQPSQPETCGFSEEAFGRFMRMALALAALVKDFTYLDADGQTYTGIEALARVERDETLKKLSRQRPEYQRLKRWYIIMGLATVHGFDGAAESGGKSSPR